MEVIIVLIVVAVVVGIILARAVRIVPQARTGVIERLENDCALEFGFVLEEGDDG